MSRNEYEMPVRKCREFVSETIPARLLRVASLADLRDKLYTLEQTGQITPDERLMFNYAIERARLEALSEEWVRNHDCDNDLCEICFSK